MSTASTRTRYRNLIFDSARWDDIELRSGDIVVSTPPKSGTTWVQMLCALIVFDGPELPAPLEQMSPWVDMLDRPIEHLRATLDAQEHRRILKTHTPLDGLPLRSDVEYVVVGRDPRDVAVSFDHHMANLDLRRFLELRASAADPDEPVVIPARPSPDPAARFRRFVTSDEDDGTLTLALVLQHLDVAWSRRHRRNVHLCHYADLRADPVGELRRLAASLGVSMDRERAAALAADASLDRMRERAGEVVPGASQGLWRDLRRFIRTGGAGEWRELTTPADDALYHRRVRSLVAPDLARWAHHGRLAR